jgi:hypothetical protein
MAAVESASYPDCGTRSGSIRTRRASAASFETDNAIETMDDLCDMT